MIIKKIKLQNIRSHKETIIDFNNGICVLSGRTGSGKSTILMAISYVLFGATHNSSLLRRNEKKGSVELTFLYNGKEYTIKRGLKRSGKNIVVDPDNLWIKINDEKLPVIARTNEINEKITRIIGYPNTNAKELFETTCYAKQDELRKLIEITNSEREKLIDKIMQLNKYELTYEHMKPLINSLSNEFSLLKGKTENISSLKENLLLKNKKLNELKKELKIEEEKLNKKKIMLNDARTRLLSSKKELQELEIKKSNYDKKKGLLNGFKKEQEEIINKLKNINIPEKTNIDLLLKEQATLFGEKSKINLEINKLNKELKNFSTLGASCPVCKQQITKEHFENVKIKINENISLLEKDLLKVNKKINIVNEKITKARKEKEVIDYVNKNNERLNELKAKIKELTNELKSLNPIGDEMVLLKKNVEKLNNEFILINNEFSTINERKRNIEIMINDISNDLNKLNENLKVLEQSKKKMILLEKKITLLKKLREDIREIRSSVRLMFLEDFRQEFQKKYEEIRPEGYSVDINNNYEPVAFADGTETPISSLSGGEKTSVALAYRLALSEISARINAISKNEFLMLDEPTTGFDRQDIGLLPNVLRKVRHIPQIIIVSHDEELKEAADYKYEFIKENNITKVNY